MKHYGYPIYPTVRGEFIVTNQKFSPEEAVNKRVGSDAALDYKSYSEPVKRCRRCRLRTPILDLTCDLAYPSSMVFVYEETYTNKECCFIRILYWILYLHLPISHFKNREVYNIFYLFYLKFCYYISSILHYFSFFHLFV